MSWHSYHDLQKVHIHPLACSRKLASSSGWWHVCVCIWVNSNVYTNIPDRGQLWKKIYLHKFKLIPWLCKREHRVPRRVQDIFMQTASRLVISYNECVKAELHYIRLVDGVEIVQFHCLGLVSPCLICSHSTMSIGWLTGWMVSRLVILPHHKFFVTTDIATDNLTPVFCGRKRSWNVSQSMFAWMYHVYMYICSCIC